MKIELFGLQIFVEIPFRSLIILFSLILAVIISYFLMIKMRKKRVFRLAQFETLKEIHGYKSISSPWLLILKTLIVSLLFLVATESISLNIVKPVSNTDFVLALDASQTMLIPDYEPNRFEFAKRTMLEWVKKLPAASKIGVLTFSERAIPLSPLTTNIFEVENSIKMAKVDMEKSGTAIGEAIQLGSSMLSTSDKQRFLIIITDGKNTAGIPIEKALEHAKKNKVIIYTIGIGFTNKTREIYERLLLLMKEKGIEGKLEFPELNETLLKQISEETGGKYFYVEDEEIFKKSFEKIIIRNERIPLNSDYYILIFIAILLALELIFFSYLGAI